MKGILGQKAGMTQIITNFGESIPVTVINTGKNIVTQIKTQEKDAYIATQLSVFEKRVKRTPKPLQGHFAKAKAKPQKFVREIRNMEGFELGKVIKVSEIFNPGDFVDVTGKAKGKGFAGVIKRHGNSIGPKSHGSQFHRQIGSMSDIEGNKISKGKKMPGQMGNSQKTTQNLEVISVNDEKEYLLVKGAIPGPNKGFVVVKQAVKNLPSKEAIKLVNLNEAKIKNELIEKAGHLGVKVSSDMEIEEMKQIIANAKPQEPKAASKESNSPDDKKEEKADKEAKPDLSASKVEPKEQVQENTKEVKVEQKDQSSKKPSDETKPQAKKDQEEKKG